MLNRIAEIEKQIKLLKEEKEKLEKAEKENLLIKNWKDMQEQVKNLTDNDVLFEFFDNETKTIPLFDKFYNTSKKFLCLPIMDFSYQGKDICGYYGYWHHATVSLILIKQWNAIKRNHRTLTASELKKYNQTNYSPLNPYTSKSGDLKRIFEEIKGLPKTEFEKSMKKNGFFNKKYYPLSSPVSLGAQISKNREGYGNTFDGTTVIEGTKYGETTEFLIVGICVGDCEDPYFNL